MRAENFIAFFTVCGFFVGLMFVTINIDDPIELVIYTLLITFFFYMLIHIVIMNYVDIGKITGKFFNTTKYEEINNYLITELSIREGRMENAVKRAEMILKKPDKPQTKKNANGPNKNKAA